MDNHDAELRKAQRHLARKDAVLKELIRLVGKCTLQHDPDGFGVLARAIVSQQISTRAARAISERLRESLGRGGVRPRSILRTSDEALRGAGLSANKVLCLRELADKVHNKVLNLEHFPEMDDEEVIEQLVELRGIGRWTAEMFLIFCLAAVMYCRTAITA